MLDVLNTNSVKHAVAREAVPLLDRVTALFTAGHGHISEVVHRWLREDGYSGIDENRPLASNLICGHTAFACQIAAALHGFDSHVYKTRLPVKSPDKLKEVLPYGACVHKVTVIRGENESVVVDGAYLQFIKSITDVLPVEDILIRRLEEIPATAERFTALNDAGSFSGRVRIMPDEIASRQLDRKTVDISLGDHSLASYLEAVWNIRSGFFCLDDSSYRTRELIANPLSEGATKAAQKTSRRIEELAEALTL